MQETFRHEMKLTEQFIQGILSLDPTETKLRVIGKKDTQNRCAVVSIQTLEVDMARAAFELDDTYGIMTRVGLHCAPSAHQTLGTYGSWGFLCKKRTFSFGPENTSEEIETAIHALDRITEL